MRHVVLEAVPSEGERLTAFLLDHREDLNWSLQEATTRAGATAAECIDSEVGFVALKPVLEPGEVIETVGMVTIVQSRKWSSDHVGVLRILVHRDYREGGLGTSLMEAAIEAAEARGIIRIEASPYARTAQSGLWFGSFGFELEGTRKKAAKLPYGEYVDVYMLARVKEDS